MNNKIKKRVRGSTFQTVAQGKVWTFRWNPQKQRLEGRQNYSRITHSISPDQLADTLCGQFSLFTPKLVPQRNEAAA
jgi:hypothetical protein